MDRSPSPVVFRSVVPSNSADAGSVNVRTKMTDVDGVNCWDSAKMRKTLMCAGDCFEGARHVCIGFLFGGGVVVAVQHPRPYLEHAALHLSLHPYHSFQLTYLTYRYHTSRHPKSGVCVQVVYRNVDNELQKKDNHTGHQLNGSVFYIFFYAYTYWWIYMYRYVSPTSQIRADVQMEIRAVCQFGLFMGHPKLFSGYWSSTNTYSYTGDHYTSLCGHSTCLKPKRPREYIWGG